MNPRTLTFSVVLDPDPEGGFTVTVPSLPSIVTQGESVEQALANAREAIELTLEDMVANGEPIPEPVSDARVERVAVTIAS
jgi:antitoxin HicB